MSQISSNSQRRSPWKIAQQSKSIIKDQSSINIYKLPSKFEPSKTNLLNETKILNKSVDRHSRSQIFSSNPLQTQNTVLAQNDKSFLHSRINLNLKPNIIKDSPQKRNYTQSNNKELTQLTMMNRMINEAPMRPSGPGDNKNALSKIKSQFIIFKQRVLKQLKQLSQMIERVRLDSAHQIQRGLKQIQLLVLNQISRDNKINKDTKNNKDINIDFKKRQQQQKEYIMKNITRQKIIKLQSNVIKLNFNLTKPNFHSFNGSFGYIDTNQSTGQKITMNLSQSQIKKTIQSPKTNRKLQFQYEKTDNIMNTQLRKSFVKQQNGEGNIKSTLDKCNQMVQTIVTLSEINASPVINRSNSNDNLMVQQYKRKLLQISKSNEKLIQQQARKKYKVQPKLKVNQKLQKFYTAIEKLKQDVNEIRNISDIKQVRKKNV